jgi:hypothetical protein
MLLTLIRKYHKNVTQNPTKSHPNLIQKLTSNLCPKTSGKLQQNFKQFRITHVLAACPALSFAGTKLDAGAES